MKTLTFLTLVWLVFSAGPAFAQSVDPAEDIRAAHAGSNEQARYAAVVNEARMSQVVQSMRREMVLLGETEDPAERQRLMNAHRGHLHEMLMLMRRTGGISISRIMQDQLVAQDGTSAPSEAGASAEDRLEHLEMRADMMQMTLEAMFEHLTMQRELQ